MATGTPREDRTGTGTLSVFGHQMRFDLREGFPILTTKKMFTRGMIAELLWIISGDTNEHTLRDQNVNFWREWADPVTGDLGPIYGKQLREQNSLVFVDDAIDPEVSIVDQLEETVTRLKEDPFSRRHVITLWNAPEVPYMRLPPCHGIVIQFYVTPDANGEPFTLSCQMYQRSGDAFLGVPINIASYSLFTHMMAQVTGLRVGEFVHTLGDAHIYLNHIEQVNVQRARTPFSLPHITLNPQVKNIDDFTLADITLTGYQHHDSIKAPIAV